MSVAEKTKAQSGAGAEAARVGKFGVVGVINTLIDFGILNALTKFAHWPIIYANLVSASTAMIFSFFANKRLVFKQTGGSLVKQTITFVAITAFGVYVIQNAIIWLLISGWTTPLHLFVTVVRGMHIHLFSDGFYINNGAKAAATLASLTWNYIMYKKVVFK